MLFSRLDVAVAVVETILAVGVGQGKFGLVQQGPGPFVFLVQGGAWIGRIEHELVKDGVVANRVIDGVAYVFMGVVVHADDRGTQYPNAAGLKLFHQSSRVHAG